MMNLAGVLLIFAATAVNAQETFNVNTKETTIRWDAEKVTGAHHGNVTLNSGKLELTDGKLTGGKFEVNMNSIVCNDLEGEWNAKLVGHLKSDDFFGVEKFPTSSIVITDVKPLEGNKYRVGANLTIKGKTNRVEFETILNNSGKKLTSTAEVIVDRSKYDVKYGSGSFFDNLGDKTIYDEFKLTINLSAAK